MIGLKRMKYSYRDTEIIPIVGDEVLVAACDSCGGIGSKEGDVVKAPPFIAGKYTARVCLMEVLSVNALPIGMSVNICNEPHPTGDEILNGINDELSEVDLNIPITISTEKNMKTSMTALGVTVFGRVNKHELLLGKVSTGDLVYTLGLPLLGNEVLNNPDKITRANTIVELLNNRDIHEIIPVGSTGVIGELNKMLNELGLKLYLEQDIDYNLEKSGGPSTITIIVTSKPIDPIQNLKLRKIGTLK